MKILVPLQLLLLLCTTTLAFENGDLICNQRMAVITEPIIEMSCGFFPPRHSPASPGEKKCRRAHQGLYNEVVEYIEQWGSYVKIAYPHIIYGFDTDTQKALNTFWTFKEYVTPITELNKEILQTIPNPEYAQEPTIVLIYPWQNFSVGTRFKHVASYDTQSTYAIVRADYTHNTILYDFIPREHAVPEIKQDAPSARKLFVSIINTLIDRVTQSGQDHVIPYVWGGSSFVHPYIQSDFYLKDGVWHRERENNPYTGFDCSEFVMRMAQIAGIDFPWKTTIAIERSRKALNAHDQLEEGDLIWVQGHVMIISNIERNEIIESRGYGSGYGCVHRITLDECFEGIATYNDLLEFYYGNKLITFKDKRGFFSGEAQIFKILKLTSL